MPRAVRGVDGGALRRRAGRRMQCDRHEVASCRPHRCDHVDAVPERRSAMRHTGGAARRRASRRRAPLAGARAATGVGKAHRRVADEPRGSGRLRGRSSSRARPACSGPRSCGGSTSCRGIPVVSAPARRFVASTISTRSTRSTGRRTIRRPWHGTSRSRTSSPASCEQRSGRELGRRRHVGERARHGCDPGRDR